MMDEEIPYGKQYLEYLHHLCNNKIDNYLNKNYNEEDVISFPSCMQFRKYWASDMKKRGYSDLEILRWLGHHDEKMLGYYGET